MKERKESDWKLLPVKLINSQYNWLNKYSQKTGDTMVSVVRHALREYKEKYDK